MTRDDSNWPDDDEAARRLRDVLNNEARSIQPSDDGLAQIRERARERRGARRAWLRPIAALGAAAATAAIVIAVVIMVPGRHSGHPVSPGATASLPNNPSTSPSLSPSPSASAGPATHPVTLYYVGAKPDPQQLLYRETVLRPDPAGKAFIGDAVTALLSTPPTDPDYLNAWPQGTSLLGATVKNNTEAIIDLSSQAADGPKGTGLGAISAQQLFYTVQGAAPKIESVELRIAGKPVTSLWGSDITNPITAKPPFEVFAHVWITTPTENATVPSVVTFGGDAIVFEANVSWQILMNGGVLKQGFDTASAGAPDQGTWQDSVTLTPGTYELRAFESSAKDGSPTYVDTKTFTVS